MALVDSTYSVLLVSISSVTLLRASTRSSWLTSRSSWALASTPASRWASALLRHAGAPRGLAPHVRAHLLPLPEALLPLLGHVVPHLLLALEVGPVPVHAVGELLGVLPRVPGQLVLHPVTRLPAELRPVLHHLLAAAIAIPVEPLRPCNLLVSIPGLCPTPGHQVVLLPGAAVAEGVGVPLQLLPAPGAVPQQGLAAGGRPRGSLLPSPRESPPVPPAPPG